MTSVEELMLSSDSISETSLESFSYNHVWTVRGYSMLESSVDISADISDESLLNDLFVSTPRRIYKYRFRILPKGDEDSSDAHTFIEIVPESEKDNPDVKVESTVFLYNDNGERIAPSSYYDKEPTTSTLHYFRRDLIIAHIEPTDVLHVSIGLVLKHQTNIKTVGYSRKPSNVNARMNELMENLHCLFMKEDKSDFILECGGEKFPVHECILTARSPVFAAMLASYTKESQSKECKIVDVDPEILKTMLLYIYTGTCPEWNPNYLDLLAVSGRFQLNGLKAHVEQSLRNHLKVENVCEYLVHADLHMATDLKRDAIRFISRESHWVMKTTGWQELFISHHALLNEVFIYINNISKKHVEDTETELSRKKPRREVREISI